MERKEKIYLYMCSREYTPLTFDELRIALDVPDCDLPELYSLLDELISEGRIFLSKKHRYATCKGNMRYVGILRCSARGGFGFVSCEDSEDDIYIASRSLATAIDGDKVLVHVTGFCRGKKEGVIERVLERANKTVSAVITEDFCASPDNRRISAKIKLTDMQDAKPGDRVLVELTDYAKSGVIYASVVSVLGSSEALSSYTDAILFEHKIKTEFDEDTLAEADSFSESISESDKLGRYDFTKDMIFTIDGDDARDFDDAVSVKILDNESYELGVHIADVSHYVHANSPLDREAFMRATSVYLPDRVIPMLPERLSNELCSLNPGVERLTLSVIMEISPDGEVINHKIVKGIIRSRYRMTYDSVAKLLDGDSALCDKYAELVPILKNMLGLSKILSKRREERGSINFDFPEARVILDDTGYPKELARCVRNDAHRLIEEFMLVANETVAEYAFWADIPFIYRVHGQPDSEKMNAFRRFIGSFGLFMKGKEIYPKDLQQILKSVADTENEALIATHMLRSLMKAEYSPECNGHFGLAAKYYCHFTSPIRRYPDLIIHRILKDFLDGKDISHYKGLVIEAAKQSGNAERDAELTERDAEDLMKAAYISGFIGCELPAKVSGVTSFGIFAELENGIEGLIRLETISGDFYEPDAENRMIIGKRHGKTYAIGDSVKIEVVGADLLTRRIDFVLKGNRPRTRIAKSHDKRFKGKRRGRKKWKNLK